MALSEVLIDFTNNTVRLDGKVVEASSCCIHMEPGKPPQVTLVMNTQLGNAVGQAEVTQEAAQAPNVTSTPPTWETEPAATQDDADASVDEVIRSANQPPGKN